MKNSWLINAMKYYKCFFNSFGTMLTLSQFETIRPIYESSPKETLSWFIQAHMQSEAYSQGKKAEQIQPFILNLKQKLEHVLSDFLHTEWKKMKVYRQEESSFEVDLTACFKIFSNQIEDAFEQFYPMMHVICTGDVSPSGGQKMFSRRGWGKRTLVSHMYRIGWSASIFCSLHGLDQLVSNSMHWKIENWGIAPSIYYYLVRMSQKSRFTIEYILQQFSNTFSATLPHVWKKILEDSKVVTGSLIVSLACGPGLTICGSIMEKRSPCG